jgi:hypothetical protein
MTPHTINEENIFIGGWIPDDTSICDRLIEYHKNDELKEPGRIRKGVDKTFKDSTDSVILDDTLLIDYANYLQILLCEYVKIYPHVNAFDAWTITEQINIQHYAPNQGYHGWHTERSGANFPGRNRHLVFMTYLNDVTDKGETEWFYQKIKIKPQKGLTLFWPVDWPFVHRGISSPSQDKYIATGWYSYIETQ